jgi:hypothetical protein
MQNFAVILPSNVKAVTCNPQFAEYAFKAYATVILSQLLMQFSVFKVRVSKPEAAVSAYA